MADQDLLIEDDDDKKKPEELEIVETPIQNQSEEDDDQEDDGDSRLSDDHEKDDVRERRRQEKHERNARRKAAIERDKTELNFLRTRNEELERRVMAIERTTVSNQIANVDTKLQETLAEVRAAERIMAKAVEAGNGEDVAKALRIRDEAINKARQLQAAKQNQAVAFKKMTEAPTQPAAPDPEVANLAKDWMSKNKWYNPNSKDETSKIVLAVDQALTDEGYNPATNEYWEELSDRVSKYIPEAKGGSNGSSNKAGGRKGPPVGQSRDSGPGSSRQQVYISPERKQAMIDAGVWDDPVLRQRYLKQYQKWDRDNNTSR